MRLRSPASASLRSAAPAAGPRELLIAVLACATGRSASFADALAAVEGAAANGDRRGLARELLGDLAIRDWIELRRTALDGEAPVARQLYELELSDRRNWDERPIRARVRFALTEKGRDRVEAMAALGSC